jgi:hypothetical protein
LPIDASEASPESGKHGETEIESIEEPATGTAGIVHVTGDGGPAAGLTMPETGMEK